MDAEILRALGAISGLSVALGPSIQTIAEWAASGIVGNEAHAVLSRTVRQLTRGIPAEDRRLQQALQRAYLNSLVVTVLRYANIHRIDLHMVTSAEIPDWCTRALRGMLPSPQGGGVITQAEGTALEAFVASTIQRIKHEAQVQTVDSIASESRLDALVSLALVTPETIEKALLDQVLLDVSQYWPGKLPERLHNWIRSSWFQDFRTSFQFSLSEDAELARQVTNALQADILQEIRRSHLDLSTQFACAREELQRVAAHQLSVTSQKAERRARIVNSPGLKQRIYGRDSEATLLLKELRDSNGRHMLPIVAPPFFGKSALLVRLLQLVTDGQDITEPGLRGIVIIRPRVLRHESKDGDAFHRAQAAEIWRAAGTLEGHAAGWAQAAEEGRPQDMAIDFWGRVDSIGPVWLIFENFEHYLRGPENPVVYNPYVLAILDEFRCRYSEHRVLWLSRYYPHVPSVQTWSDLDTAFSKGLSVSDSIDLLRSEGSDVMGTDTQLLIDLSERLHRMPAALRTAIEYVRGTRGEMGPADLLASDPVFTKFSSQDLHERFLGQVQALILQFPRPVKHLLHYLAFLNEPLPGTAVRIFEERVLSAETPGGVAMLLNSVLVSSETDTHGDKWYRLHSVGRDVVLSLWGSSECPASESDAAACYAAGNVAADGGKIDTGVALMECSETICRWAIEHAGTDWRQNLSSILHQKARLLQRSGSLVTAVLESGRAIELTEELVRDGRSDLQERLTEFLLYRGQLQLALLRHAEAAADLSRVIRFHRALSHAGNADSKIKLAEILVMIGSALCQANRNHDGLLMLQEGITALSEAGQTASLFSTLMLALDAKALTLRELHQYDQALRTWDDAIEQARSRSASGDHTALVHWARAEAERSDTLAKIEDFEGALLANSIAIEKFREVSQQRGSDVRSTLAERLEVHALLCEKTGREACIAATLDEIASLRMENSSSPRTNQSEDDADELIAMAQALDREGNFREAVRAYERAGAILRKLFENGDVSVAGRLAKALLLQANDLANGLQENRRAMPLQAEAVRVLREAIEVGHMYLRQDLAGALLSHMLLLPAVDHTNALADVESAAELYLELWEEENWSVLRQFHDALDAQRYLRNKLGCHSHERLVELQAAALRAIAKGRHTEAVSIYNEALQCESQTDAFGRPGMKGNLLVQQGLCLALAGNLAGAGAALRDAVVDRSALAAGGGRQDIAAVRRCLNILTKVLESAGENEEARLYRRRLVAIENEDTYRSDSLEPLGHLAREVTSSARGAVIRHDSIKVPLPAGWVDESYVMLVGPDVDGYSDTLVHRSEVVSSDTTVLEYSQRFVSEARAMSGFHALLSEQEIRMGSHDGVLLEYSSRGGDPEVEVTELAFITKTPGRMHLIVLSANSNRFADARHVAEMMIGEACLQGPSGKGMRMEEQRESESQSRTYRVRHNDISLSVPNEWVDSSLLFAVLPDETFSANVVVFREPRGAGGSLAEVVDRTEAGLRSTLPGFRLITKGDAKFGNNEGRLLECRWRSDEHPDIELGQLHFFLDSDLPYVAGLVFTDVAVRFASTRAYAEAMIADMRVELTDRDS